MLRNYDQCDSIFGLSRGTRSERFKRWHLYLAALVAAQLQAISNHWRISPHVAIPGCELVPTVAVHALRKLIAAGSGQVVQSKQYWAASRPPTATAASHAVTHAAGHDVRRSVPCALSEYRYRYLRSATDM